MTTILNLLKYPDRFKSLSCKVAGVSFENEGGESRQKIISFLSNDNVVFLEPDEENTYDSHAVRVMVLSDDGETKCIGFIPKKYNESVFMLLKASINVSAKILEISVPKSHNDSYGVKIQVKVEKDEN